MTQYDVLVQLVGEAVTMSREMFKHYDKLKLVEPQMVKNPIIAKTCQKLHDEKFFEKTAEWHDQLEDFYADLVDAGPDVSGEQLTEFAARLAVLGDHRELLQIALFMERAQKELAECN